MDPQFIHIDVSSLSHPMLLMGVPRIIAFPAFLARSSIIALYFKLIRLAISPEHYSSSSYSAKVSQYWRVLKLKKETFILPFSALKTIYL